MRKTAKPQSSRRVDGASIPEFGAVIVAFFFVILIPTMNLLCFAGSLSVAYAATNQAAEDIARAANLARARQIMRVAESNLTTETVFKAFRLEAADDPLMLDVIVEPLKGTRKRFPLRSGVVEAVDRSASLYQYEVITSFTVRPAVDLSAVPLVGQIPVVARATPITLRVQRAMEHPEWLALESVP
jgi:hypothetical protein